VKPNPGGRSRVWIAGLLLAGAALGSVAAVSTTGLKPAPRKMNAAELIARGKQISFSSACHDCHTPGGLYGNPDTQRMLSGSELGWEGPWGVTYPRNLTPDPETGIPDWTVEDIVAAFRTGHRPDRSPILPPMPWPVYGHMSDEDAYALAAFIKSFPPIRHKSPDRIPPGVSPTGARLTFPPPPEWDGRHLPKPAAATTPPSSL
jgi:mono/diheme cytochrome c family protein